MDKRGWMCKEYGKSGGDVCWDIPLREGGGAVRDIHPSWIGGCGRGTYRLVHPTESGECSSEHGVQSIRGLLCSAASCSVEINQSRMFASDRMTQPALFKALKACHHHQLHHTISDLVVHQSQRQQPVFVTVMARDLLPEELVESLLQQAVVLILQSHGYTAIHPLALNLLIQTVEKRTKIPPSPSPPSSHTILTIPRPPATPPQGLLHGQHPAPHNPLPDRPAIRLPHGKHPHLRPRRRTPASPLAALSASTTGTQTPLAAAPRSRRAGVHARYPPPGITARPKHARVHPQGVSPVSAQVHVLLYAELCPAGGGSGGHSAEGGARTGVGGDESCKVG